MEIYIHSPRQNPPALQANQVTDESNPAIAWVLILACFSLATKNVE